MTYRLALVAIIGLDPQLFPFVAEGRNDFFVLALLFAGIVLLQRDRRTTGLLFLALAAACKVHAGLVLPFAVAYLVWNETPRSIGAAAGSLVRSGWAAALATAAIFVPFIVWDLPSLWDDVVSYNAGGAAWSYPVSGMGFSAILRAFGVIAYPQQDFPFWAFQIVAGLAIALATLSWLRRDPGIASLLGAYAATLLAFLFFGRYFQGNYLGFIAAVAAPVPFLRPDLAARAVSALRGIRAARVPVVEPSSGPAVVVPVTFTPEGDPAAAE